MEAIRWDLQNRNIRDLTEYDRNPRTMNEEQYKNIEKSICKFGLIDRPIINLDNTIIGGHQRIRILEGRGKEVVQCWVPSRLLDPSEFKHLNLILNSAHASWDSDILANDFTLDELQGFGFADLNISDMYADLDGEPTEGADSPVDDSIDLVVCPHCKREFDATTNKKGA